jgi:hypothetical protein
MEGLDVGFAERILTGAGPIGLLAWGIFSVYRKDMNEHLANWKGQSELLVRAIQANTEALSALRTKMEADDARENHGYAYDHGSDHR